MFAVTINRTARRTVKADVAKYRGAQTSGARSPWHYIFWVVSWNFLYVTLVAVTMILS